MKFELQLLKQYLFTAFLYIIKNLRVLPKNFFPRHTFILFIFFVMIICDLFVYAVKHFSIRLLFNQLDLRSYKLFHDLNCPHCKQKGYVCTFFSKLSFTKCVVYIFYLITINQKNYEIFFVYPVFAC